MDSSMRSRSPSLPWIRLIAVVAAGEAVLGLVATFNSLLVPGPDDIAAEASRRRVATEAARDLAKGETYGTGKPLLPGIQPASGPDPTTPGTGKPFPANGAEWAYGWETKLPLDHPFAPVTFRDASGDGLKKVLRIRRHGDPELLATVYLRPGTADGTSLPPGVYDVSLGAGDTWFGPTTQFGSTGRYYRQQVLEVQAKGAFVELPPAHGTAVNATFIPTRLEDF